MFDSQSYLSELEPLVRATRRDLDPETYQPEYYYAVLKASILRLPIDWRSHARRLLIETSDAPIDAIVRTLNQDMAASTGDRDRLNCYELLLRYSLILMGNEQSLRSTGPTLGEIKS